MPGGALTANTMMMRDTGTLHLYPEVIKEMSEVVALRWFWIFGYPGFPVLFPAGLSQRDPGKMEEDQPELRQHGSRLLWSYPGTGQTLRLSKSPRSNWENLSLPTDPLDILEPGIPKATKILEENKLPVNDENIFIIASCEQKGLDFLLGKAVTNVRKNSDEDAKVDKGAGQKAAKPAAAAAFGPRVLHHHRQ